MLSDALRMLFRLRPVWLETLCARLLLVAYAAVLYPLLGQWSGHVYPAQPTFGITPCPVTLFTFGALLLTSAPLPRWLLIIPLA